MVASDGVFEFLTSQAVIDMISQNDNLLEAAKKIVSEAYNLWLTYDDRTDDITIIIIELNNFQVREGVLVEEGSSGMSGDAAPVEARPVRRVMSKAKRAVCRRIVG